MAKRSFLGMTCVKKNIHVSDAVLKGIKYDFFQKLHLLAILIGQ